MAPRDRRHIVVRRPALIDEYRSPRRGNASRPTAPVNQSAHAAGLILSLDEAERQSAGRRAQTTIAVEGADPGILLSFESFPGLELALDTMDPRGKARHPELRSVTTRVMDGEVVEQAVVFVPDGTLGYFLKRLNAYAATADRERPRNSNFVDRIRSVALASLEELWTDVLSDFPRDAVATWWELWLRRRDGNELGRLKQFASSIHPGVLIAPSVLAFPDRIVALVFATSEQLAAAIDVLDDLAELRRPAQAPELLAEENAVEQAEWVNDLAARVVVAPRQAAAVCIVDTGVFQGHPLLEHSLSIDDCHACAHGWTSIDEDGHGTEMAGLALFGDLGEAMMTGSQVHLTHVLESAKLLRLADPNPREIWGALTANAASKVEIQNPNRRRVFSMAVTASAAPAPDGYENSAVGQPTSWSAAVDALAAGLSIAVGDDGLVVLDEGGGQDSRLFVISIGNVRDLERTHLDRSDLEPAEDPSQAWNALTVGAFTTKTDMSFAPPGFDGYTALAERGELSPWSRTSVTFDRTWALKPDVVFEGGNVACPPLPGNDIQGLAVLESLTTKAPLNSARLLTTANGTSAATSQAAHLAASILSDYPDLWPETIRALVVHSARWTEPMQRAFAGATSRTARVKLLRRYGMGVPDRSVALRSAADALTLVLEDTLHPFDGHGQFREMHVHDLPWPSDVLEELGGAETRLRVTLSYFVQPNPMRRGWRGRTSYASHGMRFEVRRATETTAAFRARVNRLAREETGTTSSTSSDAAQWQFGPNERTRGSLHTDIWTGTAADLGRRGVLAVYPVGGWWKTQPDRDRSSKGVRYSLIVSVETDAEDVDIWTPVANQVGVEVEIDIGA